MRDTGKAGAAGRLPGVPRVGLLRLGSWLALLLAAVCALGSPACAQIGSARYSSMVMEAATGRVVSAVNPDAWRAPASLTKLMTLYMTFEALRDRRIGLNQLVPVSAHAASMEPTKLGLLPGTRITVEQAIEGLVTKSANDAASALGELLGGGDEARFGQMMTLRARALGMSRTVFRNASGLPDPEQLTTARDLAVLARHLVQDFPAEYHYFSIPSFMFQGRTIANHDHMLQTYPGADGMKTGYTVASGFNLVTSAVHGDVRLIGVVLGAAHPGERDQHMAVLLDSAFAQLGLPASPRREQPGIAGRLTLVATAQAATLPASRAHPAVTKVIALRHAPTGHRASVSRAGHVVSRSSTHRPVHAAAKAPAKTRTHTHEAHTTEAHAAGASARGYVRQASRDID